MGIQIALRKARRRLRRNQATPFQIFYPTSDRLKSIDNLNTTVTNEFGELDFNGFIGYPSCFLYRKLITTFTSSSPCSGVDKVLPNVLYFGKANHTYDIQLTSPIKNRTFCVTSNHVYHSPDINPSYMKSLIYNIPMRPPHMTNVTDQQNTSNIVTASFGMQYLVDLQQKALATGMPLVTYTFMEITEESFNNVLNTVKSKAITVFTHYGEKFQEHYEVLMPDGFISLERTEKIPAKYFINTAIMSTEISKDIHNLIQLKPKDVEVQWVDRITSSGDLNIKTIPVPRNKAFVEEAYPFLNDISLKDFIRDYLESDSSVLLLYGAPGTGKTSLLKQILHYANESCLITYNKDIANMDSLFSHFYDSDERFLIIEDADTYINSRQKDGNEVMKKLLNITDGLTAKKEKKVIFTCNLSNLADVDEALLREGRCYYAIHVDALQTEQAAKVLAKLGRSDLTSELPERITLANLFALTAGRREDQSTELVSTTFGFSQIK